MRISPHRISYEALRQWHQQFACLESHVNWDRCVWLNYVLRVYERHFPAHRNLGDITQLTRKTVRECIASAGGCDLVVAGFPCTNLSLLSSLNNPVSSSCCSKC